MPHIHSAACEGLKNQLSAYIDGELDDALCLAIQEHLADCNKCRIVIDTLKKTVTLYRDAPHETVPPEMHARLVKVLDLELLKKQAEAQK